MSSGSARRSTPTIQMLHAWTARRLMFSSSRWGLLRPRIFCPVYLQRVKSAPFQFPVRGACCHQPVSELSLEQTDSQLMRASARRTRGVPVRQVSGQHSDEDGLRTDRLNRLRKWLARENPVETSSRIRRGSAGSNQSAALQTK